jgi:hypothetical protein
VSTKGALICNFSLLIHHPGKAGRSEKMLAVEFLFGHTKCNSLVSLSLSVFVMIEEG